jgi:porin
MKTQTSTLASSLRQTGFISRIIGLISAFAFAGNLHAQESASPTAMAAATQASASTDPCNNLEDQIKAFGDKGVRFHFTYTGEEFANFSGGLARGSEYEGLVKIELTLDLKKLVDWNGATFYASVLYPHGNGITNKYVGDYNVLSNIDGYDSIRLFEIWLEQKFDDGKFSIRVGQLTTDNDFFVSNSGALFINSVFGVAGTVLHDVIPPIYPVGSLGIWMEYDPAPSIYLKIMVTDGDPGAQDGNNKHGLRLDLSRSSGALGFAEGGYDLKPPEGSLRLGGSYKLGCFFDTGFYKDNSGGATHHGDYGVYAVADQQLYRASVSTHDAFQGLAGFARISYAPDDRNPVYSYFDTGFNYTGPLPGRSKDIFGLAFSFEKLSDKLLQASGAPVPSHRENILEVSYLANLNDWFSVQPDLQYIINPGGTGTTPNAIAAGIRFNISF